MDNRSTLIWLNNIKYMNNRNLNLIIKYFNRISDFWYCSEKTIDQLFKSKKLRSEIKKSRNSSFYNRIIKEAKEKNVRIITILDEDYPERLKTIPDPPKVLYIKGELNDICEKSISIVGTRKPSPYGLFVADRIIKELYGLGITIVSGMASGIDSQAHISAIKNEMPTIAVLGTGVDTVYPAHNRNLYKEIQKNGAVISEFPLGTKGLPYNFPKRNRIISGISLGTLVIEAEERSGTLITVNHALEQGREVFSVPGNISSRYSKGTNRLIKEGAKLVECAEDIIEEINEFQNSKVENVLIERLIGDERKIVNVLSERQCSIDEISNILEMSVSKVSGIITMLEIKGVAKRYNGNTYTL